MPIPSLRRAFGKLALLLSLPTLFTPAFSEDMSSGNAFSDLLQSGQFDLKFRYRLAHIDQDGLPEEASVGTLRTMLGFQTGELHGFSGYVQLRNVSVLGPDDYNDTLNGNTEYPVEPDPDASELDQAYLKYTNGETAATVGRRKLKLGNQRFISDLGWRQNNRSFDSVVLENTSIPETTLFYAYAWNVNRAFTDDSPNGNFDQGTNVHLVNVAYQGLSFGRLEAYAYLLDLDGIENPNPEVFSTATFGFNFSGHRVISEGFKWNYIAEWAHQVDYGDNLRDVSLQYARVETGLAYSGVSFSGGLEIFESDGTRAFTAPLGLLHAFGGWTDRFLPAPPMGLKDFYLKASYTIEETGTFLDTTKVNGHYHYFESDHDSLTYGSEFGISVGRKFLKHYSASLKFATYDADEFSTDTTKAWFTLGANF